MATWSDLLVPSDHFDLAPRFGAYLPCIPLCNRIGDYVHCTGRVINIILKRLTVQFPPAGRLIREEVDRLTLQARGLPIPERLAPRLTKQGTLDLTSSNLFVRDVELHGRLVDHARSINLMVDGPFGKMNYASALGTLLRTLHGLHNLWRQKTPFSPADLTNYRSLATRFGQIWHGLGWKVSSWVHLPYVCWVPFCIDIRSVFA
jgi:hypothetical protein